MMKFCPENHFLINQQQSSYVLNWHFIFKKITFGTFHDPKLAAFYHEALIACL
jgi:hypothetical protein